MEGWMFGLIHPARFFITSGQASLAGSSETTDSHKIFGRAKKGLPKTVPPASLWQRIRSAGLKKTTDSP
jgi:hypothetical protein